MFEFVSMITRYIQIFSLIESKEYKFNQIIILIFDLRHIMHKHNVAQPRINVERERCQRSCAQKEVLLLR